MSPSHRNDDTSDLLTGMNGGDSDTAINCACIVCPQKPTRWTGGMISANFNVEFQYFQLSVLNKKNDKHKMSDNIKVNMNISD